MKPFIILLPRKNREIGPGLSRRDEGLTHDLLMEGRRAFRDSVIGDKI